MSLNQSIEKNKILTLILSILVFQAIGGTIGWITSSNIDGWYQTLGKSDLTPPDYLFGVVWSILYLILSIVFWIVATKPPSKEKTFILRLFIGHMILNWAWSPVFFMAHALLASLVLITAVLTTAIWLASLIYKSYGGLSFSFIPYIAWLCFASYLCFAIFVKN